MSKSKKSFSLEKRLIAIEEKLETGLHEMAESIRSLKMRLLRSEMALAGVLFLGGILAKALIDYWVKGGGPGP